MAPHRPQPNRAHPADVARRTGAAGASVGAAAEAPRAPRRAGGRGAGRTAARLRLERGFTLLELMISLSILAVAFTAALGLQVTAVRVGTSANLMHVGSTLLDTYVDELTARYIVAVKEMNAGAAPIEDSVTIADLQTLNRTFTVAWIVTPHASRNGQATLNVTVSWEDASAGAAKDWTINETVELGGGAFVE